MNDKADIKFHFHKAEKIALKEVERLARKILLKNPSLNEFVMAMGGAFFTTKKTDDILQLDDRKYFSPLCNFIGEWDNYLHLTGTPMRFTATGPMVTDW